MRGVSIDRLKEEVSILEILAEYGATANGAGWGDWKPINCPWCGDTNGSASYNLAGYYLCHQCGAPDRDNGKAGDIIDVVAFAERLTKKDAIEWISRRFL